jgi:hypothetical protein
MVTHFEIESSNEHVDGDLSIQLHNVVMRMIDKSVDREYLKAYNKGDVNS